MSADIFQLYGSPTSRWLAACGSNLSEAMWLKSELTALDAAFEAQGQIVA